MPRDPDFFRRRQTDNYGAYSITGTSGHPGQPLFIEFFDAENNPIGYVDVRYEGHPELAPRQIVVPREDNTEEQHRTLDLAVAKLRELRGEKGKDLEYSPISIHDMDLVSIVQRMKPDRARDVLVLLARTLERELEPERTKEKK